MTETNPNQQPPEEQDPREQGLKPPFPEQAQSFPSYVARMEPPPDHGEDTYRGNGRLEGRAALITGADSGIGRAIALAYAREGADILIAYFNEGVDAEETRKLVEDAGRKAVCVPSDVREEADCAMLVQRMMDEFGHLDVLVNNAGYRMSYPYITNISTEDFDRAFRTNIYGMFFLCRAAIPYMKPGGSIINTASIQAFDPTPNYLPYAASKGAVVAFSKALAKMVIEQGIRVNVVAPGPVWTPLIPQALPTAELPNFGSETILGRPAQPAEIAPVYVLLASPEASYITGAVYEVAGGIIIT
ncbi:MAG: SDR family oxidoreductase [Chloroflexi bacterium]|jgi:NAD(P)-dependent dehydrogenase (short-subunit alcohol dehydrogenase family)|nr:SDR family oxidoreductase [Anaerolineaceae bacterium]NMB90951.1 SDR family oxidoreductase [Chloroflexota bacterium]